MQEIKIDKGNKSKSIRKIQMIITREDALDLRNFLSFPKVKKLIPSTGYTKNFKMDLERVLNKD